MDQKSTQLIEALKRDPSIAQRLLSSPEGQTLLHLVQQDGGQALRSAEQGNPKALSAMLSDLLHRPEGAQLLQKIKEQLPL